MNHVKWNWGTLLIGLSNIFDPVTTSVRRSAEGDHPVSLGRLAVGNLSALASNPWTYAEWDKYFWSALDIAQNLLSTYVITDTFVNQIKEKRQVRYIKYRIAVLRELVQELVDDLVVQGAAESRQLVTIPPCKYVWKIKENLLFWCPKTTTVLNRMMKHRTQARRAAVGGSAE